MRCSPWTDCAEEPLDLDARCNGGNPRADTASSLLVTGALQALESTDGVPDRAEIGLISTKVGLVATAGNHDVEPRAEQT